MGLPPQKYKNLFQDKKIEITAKADKKLSFNFNYRKYVFFKTKKKATAPPIFSASSVYNKQKSRYIKKAPEQRFKLTIVEASNRVLNNLPERISKVVTHYLKINNIDLLTSTKITKVSQDGLFTTDGTFIKSQLVI